jgi:hypothetical protein
MPSVTDNVERVFTAEDRRLQLEALARLCGEVADLLAAHGETWHADDLRGRGAEAHRLLDQGFTKDDLNGLAGQFPAGPDWLNPKFVDYNGPREGWQEAVAALMSEARQVALDLRAVATVRPT